jgi:hypothetical protein
MGNGYTLAFSKLSGPRTRIGNRADDFVAQLDRLLDAIVIDLHNVGAADSTQGHLDQQLARTDHGLWHFFDFNNGRTPTHEHSHGKQSSGILAGGATRHWSHCQNRGFFRQRPIFLSQILKR